MKYKTHADLYRKTQTMETGIPLRLWRHYLEIQKTTGVAVWLVFVHEQEDELRGLTVDKLSPLVREYNGSRMSWGGMAFFPWEKLQRLAVLSDLRQRFVSEEVAA